jgi:hypothetical protein
MPFGGQLEESEFIQHKAEGTSHKEKILFTLTGLGSGDCPAKPDGFGRINPRP